MTRSQLVFGLAFILIGVLLLLDRAGLASTWVVVARWWPVVVVLAGLAQLVTRPRNTVGGGLLLLIGGGLLLWTLGVVDSIAVIWPLLLIGLGLWLLAGRRRRGQIVGTPLDVSAVFDDRSFTLDRGPFNGGSVTTVFGDLELDLRPGSLEPGGATLEVTTIVGDVELRVPPGWRVSASGPELLGDVTVTGVSDDADAPTLRLRVLTLLGDVDVKGG